MCRHCTPKPGADVTPQCSFLILWKIRPGVNCLLWQRISGAQLEESSAPLPLSPRAYGSNSTDYHAGESCSIWLSRNILRASFKAHSNAR